MDIIWDTYEGHTGLCDRLRALASMVAVAEVMDAERIFVRWWPNGACPFGFQELFESSLIIPYVYDFEIEEEIRASSTVLNHPLNWGRFPFQQAYSRFFPDERTFRMAWKNGMTSIMDGAVILPEVVEWSKGREGRLMTGIHIRRTDAIGTYKMSPGDVELLDQALWDTVLKHAAEYPETQFFLASDDASYFESWSRRLAAAGLDVAVYPKTFRKAMRQTSGDAVIADILCLSLCKRIYCTASSSVLLVASGINCCPAIVQVTPQVPVTA